MDHIQAFIRVTKVFLTICQFYIKLGFIYIARWNEPALRTSNLIIKAKSTVITARLVYNGDGFSPIGDDHALGVGDYSTITAGSGIAHKLTKELVKEVFIRQIWQIYNQGECKTSTEDWLHPADSKRKEKPDLLNKILCDPKYIKTEVVIIMLRAYDTLQKEPSVTPEDTVRNLKLICQALRKTGNEAKSIYLCTAPTAGDDIYLTEEQRIGNLTRNQLIVAYTNKNNDGVRPGLQLDLANNFEMKRRNLYWRDGRHFSEIGYTKIAKDLVPQIRPDIVKREFSLFRSDLGL